jgi:2',3'-cyclic-nucleotide 2'-phosphodiesterase/3'-nucleotidase/5'-nucleotidase
MALRSIPRALIYGLIAATSAAAQSARAPLDLRIVSTTDLHGRIRSWDYFADTAEGSRGLSRVATIVDSIRADKPNGTILVDAGDFLQGNALTYVASRPGVGGPHPVVAAMNALKYDAVVLGNHEFNYGLATLDRAMSTATFAVLAANARRMDKGKQWQPIAFINRGGVRVAVIGLTTPWAMVWDRDLLKGRVQIDDIVSSAKRAVVDARRGGADVVVVVAHAGLDPASGREDEVPGVARENPMSTVAREVPGIDLIVFGHTHRELADSTINGVLMMQPRNWATSVGVASLRVEPEGRGWKVTTKRGAIVRSAGHDEHKAIVAVAERAHAAARKYANATIGKTSVAWTTDSARTTDTPLIDFIGETMRRASGADLASTAVFSTRIRIAPGPISVAKLAQLYPYDNTLRIVKLSGAKLKEYLEQSARYFRVTGEGDARRAQPDPSFIGFNFEVVTGATYAMDISRPAGDRITGLAVKGKAVQPADSFTIALTNYRASGTGGYTMLIGAPVVKDDQREVRQLLIDDLTKRKELKPGNYFTQSWSVVPAPLASQVQAALSREVDFDAARPPATTGPRPPAAGGATGAQGAKPTMLRLIGTSDFHGALEARPDGTAGMRGGAAHFAATLKRLAAECTGSCVSLHVDGGDQFQGTPASNLAYGRPVVAMFNAVGLAASAVGNHDFDWGQDTLRARMREAKYGMFAANVTDAQGRPLSWLRPDTLIERGGLKIGVIGLATVTTPSVTQPRNVADLRFHRPGPIVVERARLLRERGADMVIVASHAGAGCTPEACTGEMADLAREAAGSIDAIVGGHNHIEFSSIIAGVPVVRSRSSGRGVRYVDIPVDRAARTALDSRLVFVATDSIAPDPQVATIIGQFTEAVKAIVERPIATVPELMPRRGAQYALGNLIADAQRAAAQADVAVMNNGGIRTDLRAGPATYGSFFEISPFANLLMRMTVTGADLRAYFERVVGGTSVRAHASGVMVRFDPAKPAGQRILDITVNGSAVDPARMYTIAMSDFMATGGDGLALAGPANKTEALGIIDIDALIAYVQALPGGVIRADATARIAPVP